MKCRSVFEGGGVQWRYRLICFWGGLSPAFNYALKWEVEGQVSRPGLFWGGSRLFPARSLLRPGRAYLGARPCGHSPPAPLGEIASLFGDWYQWPALCFHYHLSATLGYWEDSTKFSAATTESSRCDSNIFSPGIGEPSKSKPITLRRMAKCLPVEISPLIGVASRNPRNFRPPSRSSHYDSTLVFGVSPTWNKTMSCPRHFSSKPRSLICPEHD